MFKCQPSKWFWGLLPLAVLSLGAWYFNSPSLETRLSNAAGAQLTSGGADWATVIMDGRDATITGEAPDEAAITKAAGLVAGAYGIRRVDSSGVSIAVPVVLDKPTVNKTAGNSTTPEISGTWPEGKATTLAVSIAGTTYALGSDGPLTSDGSGNWKLVPPTALADGEYEVDVEITDGKKAAASDASESEVVVDTTPPAEPTITGPTGDPAQPTIAGGYDKAAAKLAVTAAGTTYVLGKDDALSADEAGTWTLAMPGKLEAGSYDVSVSTQDEYGNVSSANKAGLLTVAAPRPPAAPTIAKVEGFGNTPKVTGTWPQEDGNALQVDLAGKAYKLGTDRELSTDNAGNWSLAPSSPLKDGTYDVVATVSNAAGLTASNSSASEVHVDTTPPASPTVAKVSGKSARPVISGAWDEGDAKTLTVAVNGSSHDLGKTGPLTSDGKGNWRLQLADDLPDGTHDVIATATDEAGNSASDQSTGEIVVDSTPPAVPTVNTLLTRERQPTVTGSWPSKDAALLSVVAGSRTYTVGDSDALKVDGDNWVLNIDERLQDGTYDVTAKATDNAGNTATDASKDELVVDATPPVLPTVNAYKSEDGRPLLTGTFPESDADGMTIQFESETFTLGSPSGPSSDGKGNWSVQTGKEYAPGKYNVKVAVTDRAGNERSDVTIDEVEILAPPPPKPATPEPAPAPAPAPAPVAEVAIDCQKLIDDLLAATPINFRTSGAQVTESSSQVIGKLAEIISQCPDAKIEIGGHTDARGSASFNQKLSEQRAAAVRDALVASGATASNITAVGYGESQPIADNATEEGRAINRRTVFKVQP